MVWIIERWQKRNWKPILRHTYSTKDIGTIALSKFRSLSPFKYRLIRYIRDEEAEK